MAPRRIVVVVNPKAQNGALGRRWPELAATLRRELGGFEEARTTGPGDATRLAAQAIAAGADVVVAIGGDGTISEVAAGFFDGDRPRPGHAALGIIPFGTGGDFRKTLRLPRDAAAAARVVAQGRARPIDVGHLRYTLRDGGAAERIFVNIASFGIGGLVDEIVNTGSKALGGTLSFYLATVRAGRRYHNQRVRLVFDGDEAAASEMTMLSVAVANGQYFGGGLHIAPSAELDDGAFDVVALGDFGMLDILFRIGQVRRGQHLAMDKVSSRRARQLDATSIDGSEVLLDVDGEAPGMLPASFRVLPRALQVIAP